MEIPAPSGEDDEDFISEAKLRKMARSDVIDLATDAGLDKNEMLDMETSKIVDKLLAEFGVE